jgi:predicted 3-demethylubiquinone-9 3-methyltransferase (glyoxalase superfamily)
MAKNTICLWYDKDAEAAARFYAETFPDSVVGAVHRAPSDYPSGKAGDPLIVESTVAGVPCIGLNGGPAFNITKQKSSFKSVDEYIAAQPDSLQRALRRVWKQYKTRGAKAFLHAKAPGKSRSTRRSWRREACSGD